MFYTQLKKETNVVFNEINYDFNYYFNEIN